jgi:hypothetical protein
MHHDRGAAGVTAVAVTFMPSSPPPYGLASRQVHSLWKRRPAAAGSGASGRARARLQRTPGAAVRVCRGSWTRLPTCSACGTSWGSRGAWERRVGSAPSRGVAWRSGAGLRRSSGVLPAGRGGPRPAEAPSSGPAHAAAERTGASRGPRHGWAMGPALWWPQGPARPRAGHGRDGVIRCRQEARRRRRRSQAGVSVAAARPWGVRPGGRPGPRLGVDGGGGAAALARRAAGAAARRPLGATRRGQARRAGTRSHERATKATPGPLLRDRLAKTRARPSVGCPALGTTTASPARRATAPGRSTGGRPQPPNRMAPGRACAKTRWTGRSRPPFPAQRESPSLVTRPVRTRLAHAIRWRGRRVVVVRAGWRPWHRAHMASVGGSVGRAWWSWWTTPLEQHYESSPFQGAPCGEGIDTEEGC